MKIYQTDFAKVFFGEKKDDLDECTKLIKLPIVFGHQVHGSDLLEIHSNEKASICLYTSSDGLFTRKRELPLGIYTADCVPCILATKNTLFSLHLGWRGIYSGLLKKALKFLAKGEKLEVFVGPHIGASSFEVQKDLVDKFSVEFGAIKIWSKQINDSYFISLIELIKEELKMSNLDYDLYFDEQDTFKSEKHYSYRGDNKTTKRNLSISFLRS